jgi:hypothetical protein
MALMIAPNGPGIFQGPQVRNYALATLTGPFVEEFWLWGLMCLARRRHNRRLFPMKYVVYNPSIVSETTSLNATDEPRLIKLSKHEIVVVRANVITGMDEFGWAYAHR